MLVFLAISAVIQTCVAEHDLCSNDVNSCSTDIPCPSAGGTCPSDATCCPTGCCPLPGAVCCSDLKHCCPSGSFCNLELQMCIGSKEQFLNMLQEKEQLHSDRNSRPSIIGSYGKALAETFPKDIPCPSAGGSCPDYTTCCSFGCCPFQNAVCCEDNLYCCPSGMICDPEHGFCVKSEGQVFAASPMEKRGSFGLNMFKSMLMRNAQSALVDIVYCPGGQVYCPDFNTCCPTPSGTWGCCPFPSATCCPDKIHCCPAGYRCGPTSQGCFYAELDDVPQRKFPALSLRDK